jgi:hypothetical protein
MQAPSHSMMKMMTISQSLSSSSFSGIIFTVSGATCKLRLVSSFLSSPAIELFASMSDASAMFVVWVFVELVG